MDEGAHMSKARFWSNTPSVWHWVELSLLPSGRVELSAMGEIDIRW